MQNKLFLEGNNCAQSVVLSFAEDYGYSKELALKIAAGFGGGMGRIQGTCGAVSWCNHGAGNKGRRRRRQTTMSSNPDLRFSQRTHFEIHR